MKKIIGIFLMSLSLNSFSQKIDSIVIPKGVTYKYCDSATFAKAKSAIDRELSDKAENNIVGMILFVGPNLWARYSKIKPLSKIENGNMNIIADNKKLTGKMTQDKNDSQKFWDQIKKEVTGQEYTLRKATPSELRYYWAVISFDIEEPLIVLETKEHKYLLNFTKKDMELMWIDEVF